MEISGIMQNAADLPTPTHTYIHTPHLCSNTLCVGACAAIVCLFCVSYNMLIATVCMFAY